MAVFVVFELREGLRKVQSFIQAHLYILGIPVLLLLLMAIRLLSKQRKVKREIEEMSQYKRRDEALVEALRNPQVKEESGPEGPMEISWDDKTVSERGKDHASPMVELVELSAYSRKKFVFRLGKPIRIGSEKENQMELLREGVEESHCEIFLNGEKACVRSLSGSKTILKRGKTSALIGPSGVYLNNGDRIQLGTVELQVRLFKG